MSETEMLADRAVSVEYDEVPDEAVASAKRSIRDIVGLALHGSTHPVGEPIGAYLDTIGTSGGATVIGWGTADPVRAAFANGAFCHILEYNDTFESVVIHPSCTAFPAAFAASELDDATGRDLLTGYVVGLDVAFRVGRSVAPSHWHSGWHSTATIGVFGATAAAASVLGLDVTETRHALGIAAAFSSGLKKNIATPTTPIQCGHAGGKGVEAAVLAREGARADDAIMEGPYGFGTVATDPNGYSPDEITDPQVEWAVLDSGLKPYPCGTPTHASMQALQSLVERERLTVDRVDRVTVEIDERVSDTVDEHDPDNALEAGLSYEFCLAAILRRGKAGVAEFTDEFVRDPATREAMEKIRLDPQPDPFDSNEAEVSYGGRVTVTTTDGETFEAERRSAPGTPSNPLPEERWREKFYECAEKALDREAVERLEQTIMTLDEDNALARLTAATRLA